MKPLKLSLGCYFLIVSILILLLLLSWMFILLIGFGLMGIDPSEPIWTPALDLFGYTPLIYGVCMVIFTLQKIGDVRFGYLHILLLIIESIAIYFSYVDLVNSRYFEIVSGTFVLLIPQIVMSIFLSVEIFKRKYYFIQNTVI
jgi:hypothetical protein